MATINVGKVRPTYKGVYDSDTAYDFFDWVTYEGSSYICINTSGVNAGTSISDEDYWACLAQKGDAGDNGTDGTTISNVNVNVGSNTGTPSGSGSVSGSTLTLSFDGLKGSDGTNAVFQVFTSTPTVSQVAEGEVVFVIEE